MQFTSQPSTENAKASIFGVNCIYLRNQKHTASEIWTTIITQFARHMGRRRYKCQANCVFSPLSCCMYRSVPKYYRSCIPADFHWDPGKNHLHISFFGGIPPTCQVTWVTYTVQISKAVRFCFTR